MKEIKIEVKYDDNFSFLQACDDTQISWKLINYTNEIASYFLKPESEEQHFDFKTRYKELKGLTLKRKQL